ncbi:MAG: type VII toxin-antitoxin system MntA family adenylyltransferase antitoxin [Candidatus Freyarchaeota archaeon]
MGECLEKNRNVVFAYVYGSHARGEASRFSDLDVAVFLKDSGHESYMELLSTLPVDEGVELDVRVLNNAPPLFRYNVIREGTLLFVRDKKVHEEFVYNTLVSALELKETLTRMRKETLERNLDTL